LIEYSVRRVWRDCSRDVTEVGVIDGVVGTGGGGGDGGRKTLLRDGWSEDEVEDDTEPNLFRMELNALVVLVDLDMDVGEGDDGREGGLDDEADADEDD
jgi:hypothetical protein